MEKETGKLTASKGCTRFQLGHMPVFKLSDQYLFPPPHLAEKSGLLAVGGDLAPGRLVEGYRQGIFPWFSPGDPLLWWAPQPRLVLFPHEFHIPKRLARYARNSQYSLTRDRAFEEVIHLCATVRTTQGLETWITPEMKDAYIRLHRMGYAHSIECWDGDRLTGGLYGVALDRVFFGESMFSRKKCCSQFALIHLVQYIKKLKFAVIDCQMTTDHLLRFGAREISGPSFQRLLKKNIQNLSPQGLWNNDPGNSTNQLQNL